MPDEHAEHHVVIVGDTLSALAQHYYGDGSEHAWRRIYEANREIIGHDPDMLALDLKLVIPSSEQHRKE